MSTKPIKGGVVSMFIRLIEGGVVSMFITFYWRRCDFCVCQAN